MWRCEERAMTYILCYAQALKINMNKKINILSLFAGMGTLELALINQGFVIGKSYASEIKPHAIKLMRHHFPNTIQLGDIRNWREWNIDWESIDFVGSGSPCKDLSIAGKMKGIHGSNSGLFWYFVVILNHIKKLNPEVIFLQENVYSAARKEIAIMSEALGVYPQMIDSSLFTAQLRKRWYWTNIKTCETIFDKVVCFPKQKDKGILLQDILEHGYTDRNKARAILESESRLHQDMDLMYKRYKNTGFGNIVYQLNPNKESNGQQPYMQNRVYSDKGKHTSLTESHENRTQIAYEYKGKFKIRPLTQTELERLQGFPDGFTSILTKNQAASLLGDGWTLPVIEYLISFIDKTKYKTRKTECSTAIC